MINSKTKMMIEIILLLSGFIAGVVLLVLGINYKQKEKTYQPVLGYLSNYESNNDTYEVIYSYTVLNKTFNYVTSLDSISDDNKIIKLKYNPNNPEEVIEGDNNYLYFYFLGMSALFMGIPIVFLIGFLYKLNIFPKIKIDIVSLAIGLLFLIIGIIFLIVFKSMGDDYIVPVVIMILFIIVGIISIIQSLNIKKFLKKEKKKNPNKIYLYNSMQVPVGIPTIIVGALISILIGIYLIHDSIDNIFTLFMFLGIILTLIGSMILFQILFIKIKQKLTKETSNMTKVEQENEMITSIVELLVFIRKYSGIIGLILILLLILEIL